MQIPLWTGLCDNNASHDMSRVPWESWSDSALSDFESFKGKLVFPVHYHAKSSGMAFLPSKELSFVIESWQQQQLVYGDYLNLS